MLEQLTRKEQSIVWLQMQGLAPKKIASKLRTSYIIIHLHLSHIRKKLSVHSTIEIMRCVGTGMDIPPHAIKLTPRGKEVFRLTLDCFSISRIAFYLEISRSGVRRHREKML